MSDSTEPTTTRRRSNAAKPPAKPKAETPAQMKARLRAEIEAEMRAEIEAELRAEVEAQAEGDDLTLEKLFDPNFQDGPAPDLRVPDQIPRNAIHVHFIADGYTILGKMWYRGEELIVEPNTQQWDEVHDRNGNTTLTLDEYEQEDRWGETKLRPGPWRGKSLASLLDDDSLTDEEKDRLAQIANGSVRAPRSGSKTTPSFLSRSGQ